MREWVCLNTRMLAELLGRNTPSRKTDVSALEVQDRKDEFVALQFDNVQRGVLRVRGDGRRDTEYRFEWASPGFASDWRPSDAHRNECAVRAWAQIERLRERFAEVG